MSRLALASIDHDDPSLGELNAGLADQTAEQRVRWSGLRRVCRRCRHGGRLSADSHVASDAAS